MNKNNHKVEILVNCKPEWGTLRHIISSTDNRSIVLYFYEEEEIVRGRLPARLVFKDKTIDVPHRIQYYFALSFNGKKLAIARQFSSNPLRYEVVVNDQQIWQSEDLFRVRHLKWLDNDRLVWSGWFENKDESLDSEKKGIYYFLDGKDKTGSLLFEPYADKSVGVQEKSTCYTILGDGSRVDEHPACCDNFISCYCRFDKSPPETVWPTEERNEKINKVKISFNKKTSEWFDEIENPGGTKPYSFNSDQTRVGYVGVRYTGFARKIKRWCENKILLADTKQKKDGKFPWWAWPFTLVYNPNIGIVYGLQESQKRYYPVNNGQTWKKGWLFISDHFFTPKNEFVVIAHTDTKQQVVIDEKEGPLFDEICNVHFLKNKNRVCYLARQGSEIMRVTVLSDSGR